VLLQWVEDHQESDWEKDTKNWSSAWEIVIICHKLFVGWVFCCVWAAFGLCSAGGAVLCLLVLSLELWVEA
jgi:hypothetical protein